MVRNLRVFGSALVVVLMSVVVGQAANITKAIADAEGRKRAAENGMKEIKTKSPDASQQAQAAYEDAARSQNAWLDAICGALTEGTTTMPDVSSSAQSAATSLVQWVNIRNRALGVAELTEPIADSVKKSVAADLVDIAVQTWKSNAVANPKKRATAAESLNQRLRWRPVDEIQ